MTSKEVKNIRISLNLTQKQLADLCGCTLRTYQRWEESGVNRHVERLLMLMTSEEVRKLASRL
ncbi:hypothetical protein CI610_01366 [invertebrate metagenome]|uniref:HTH cro/C1-type domain-containing protein n=1 Tax=invertebrate metagenome TaxID=1711999 RepID=A0A2H9T8U3_9ZZZZ